MWKNFAICDEKFYLIDDDGDLAEPGECLEDLKLWYTALTTDYPKYCDLQYDLSITADDANEMSHRYCKGDHMNLLNCEWYHSTWQYLRLFNMVSTPGWHSEFYIREINKIVEEKKHIKALISGCADYSTYYFLCKGLKEPTNHEIDVLDMCKTPLKLVEKYSLYKYDKKVNTIQSHILNLKNSGYDLIITDAFLTRFNPRELKDLLSVWHEALIPGGKVVTTLRYYNQNYKHGDPSKEELNRFIEKFHARYKKWKPVMHIAEEKLELMVKTYAESMKSSNLGQLEDILNIAKECGFTIELTEKVEVSGELYPSAYCRLVLRREN